MIHRDIKSENILLSEDHALVADFGIAQALAGAEGDQQRLTETGTTLGTPAYMSPEQAAGARSLDARSDIYSLACVLWEMLAGEPPFSGPTPQAVIARRFTESPRPLRAVRETVPEIVEKAVAKALSKSPADRFSSALKRALALGPDTPEARLALGTYYGFIAGKYSEALKQFALGRRADPNNAELLSAAALSEQSLDRWENALEYLKQAEVLDPRSSLVLGRLARTQLWLRLHDAAAATADRGILVEPTGVMMHQIKAMALLGKGDLARARAAIRAVPDEVDPTTVVFQLANYWDLAWAWTPTTRRCSSG